MFHLYSIDGNLDTLAPIQIKGKFIEMQTVSMLHGLCTKSVHLRFTAYISY